MQLGFQKMLKQFQSNRDMTSNRKYWDAEKREHNLKNIFKKNCYKETLLNEIQFPNNLSMNW
jgi:hypothetical protein